MPTVSRITEASVNAAPLPNARLIAHMDPNAVGSALQGLDNLGSAVVKVMEQEKARVDQTALLAAQKAVGDHERMQWSSENPQGVYAFRGANAGAAMGKQLPLYDQTLSQVRATLKSPQAQADFDRWSAGRRESFADRINTYQVGEHRTYENETFQAAVESTSNEATTAFREGRPDDFNARVADGLAAVERRAQVEGWDPRQTEVARTNYLGQTHYNTVAALIADKREIEAQAFFDAHHKELQGNKYLDQIEEKLRPYIEDAQGKEDAKSILGGDHAPPDLISSGQAVKTTPRGSPSPEVATALDNAARKYGVPRWDLYALAEQESGFQPKARNRQALDDGDHAQGLFQYRTSTSQQLGDFNRDDPATSADAAAKEFKARMDARGEEFAMAAHFAGDNLKMHGAKTREYQAEVADRARRWRKKLGDEPVATGGDVAAADASGAVTQSAGAQTVSGTFGVPMTRGEALVAAERLPAMRQERAMVEIERHFKIQEVQTKEAEEKIGERMNLAMANAKPGQSVRDVLGNDYEFAAKKGLVKSWENQLKADTVSVVTPPAKKYALYKQIEVALANPQSDSAKALLGKDPWDPALGWGDAERNTLANARKLLQNGDPKAIAKAATEAQKTSIISTIAQQNMGITFNSGRAVGEESIARFHTLESMVQTWAGEFPTHHGGRDPSYAEIQKYADDLTFQIPAVVNTGWRERTTTVPALEFKAEQIPPRAQDAVLKTLREAYPAVKNDDFPDRLKKMTYMKMVHAGKIQ